MIGVWPLLLFQIAAGSQTAHDRVLEIGKIYEGRIEAGDGIASTRLLEERFPPIPVRTKGFKFVAPENGRYYVDLRSREFDTYLIVRDSQDNLLGEDDDGWILPQARVVVDLRQQETYAVASCALLGGIGKFELTIHSGDPPQPTPEELSLWKNDSREVACSLRYRANQFLEKDSFEEARQLYEQSLKTAEENLGEESQETATELYFLGRFHSLQDNFVEAREFLNRAIRVQEKLLGPEDVQTCDSYLELGSLLDKTGNYSESKILFERALQGYEKKRVSAESRIGYESLNRCAKAFFRTGNWEKSRVFLVQSLPLAEKLYGKQSSRFINDLTLLGTCSLLQGDRPQAKEYYAQALKIQEPLGVAQQGTTFELRNRMASLLSNEGNYNDAQELLEKNLRTAPVNGEKQGVDQPNSLSELGSLYRFQGISQKAKLAYEQALAIYKRILGNHNSFVMNASRNLARIELELLNLDPARELLENAKKINDQNQSLAYAVPSKIQLLADWGNLYFLQGDFKRARQCYEESIKLAESGISGSKFADASIYQELACSLIESGESQAAWTSVCKAHAAVEHNLHNMMRSLSEPERFEFIKTQRLALESTLSLAQQLNTPASIEFAFDALCAWKGQLFQGMLSTKQRVFQTSKRETVEALAQLRKVQSQISALFDSLEPKDIPIAAQKMEELQRTRGELEKTIEQSIGSMESKPIGWETLQAALPPESSFVSFVEHRLYIPSVRKEGRVIEKATWSPPQISAWILNRDDNCPTQVSLGSASELEKLLGAFLSELVSQRPAIAMTNPKRLQLNDEVFKKLWEPLRSRIDGKLLFVSSDGCLGTLPLGVIQNPEGRYLVEDFNFVCLQEAANISKFRGPTSHAIGNLLAIGGVDFQKPIRSQEKASEETLLAERGLRQNFRRSWPSLPGTADEAEAVCKSHEENGEKQARVLLRDGAPTEERLKMELPKFSFIHIASHGFFNPEGLESFWDQVRIVKQDAPTNRSEFRPHFQGFMPGLLSGIVCAGANLPPEENRENGLLTAEEVSWLDLSHCDLVVLSACETGLGTVRGGEGVVGLRSAFRQAGAKTVISSLWSIGDRSTKELMQRFYSALWKEKKGKIESLRQAQLEMLAEQRERFKGQGFPFAWGAFVLDGDWR